MWFSQGSLLGSLLALAGSNTNSELRSDAHVQNYPYELSSNAFLCGVTELFYRSALQRICFPVR